MSGLDVPRSSGGERSCVVLSAPSLARRRVAEMARVGRESMTADISALMCGILVAVGLVAEGSDLDDDCGVQLNVLRHRTRQRGGSRDSLAVVSIAL